jgi:glycosyltransferase involved in cell wall biosynthesis
MARIALLQALDYADPENVGGASRVALALGRELGASGWDVTFFSGCKGHEGIRRHEGLTFCHFDSSLSEERTFLSNLGLLRRPARVLGRCYEGPPQILFCHQPFVTWTLRRLVARVPLVYFFHSPWAEEYRARIGTRRVDRFLQAGLRTGCERWALARARWVFVASDFMRREILRSHPGTRLRGKIEVMPHGVDTDHFRPRGEKRALRRALGLPLDRRILITTRRLEDRMGLEELLRAVDICRRSLPGIFLVVVGRGRLERRLAELAATLGLDRHVRFWGYARDNELPELYTASDLFVLPTQALEGFGLVILEAAACGLPVAATPVGAIPEIVGRMGPGHLAAGTDPGALAERIGEVVGRDAGGRNGRYRDFVLENYSWKRCAEIFAARARALVAGN